MNLNAQAIWKGFENKVLQKGAGDIQRAEMRMAFMAGMSVGASKLYEGKTEAEVTRMAILIGEAGAEYTNGKTSMEIYNKYERLEDEK